MASNAPSRPATAARSAGGASVPGETTVNDFLSYDASKKTATLRIIAAYGSNNGGMNFNGGARGDQTITIPVGWTVKSHVVNRDAIPHSAIVIADVTPLPVIPDNPAIPRAYTAHLTDGLAPQDGADDMTFKPSKAGSYVLVCGVPGHGPSGMWIHLVVSSDATVPAYKM
jgi:sulfocyanin